LLSKADSVRLYKIRKVISELSSKEGRGTELVSLYIPPKKPLHEVLNYLKTEWGQAGNIKSDTTRNHVQDALTKTMQRLKLYRESPETGLVIFSGALPTNGPGSEVIRLNEIVPPKAVNTFLYMCVAPGTKVLMADGNQKTMEALKGSWTNERVMSWDGERRELKQSAIKEYLNIPVGGRRTYRLTVESGRSIVATEDHPFQTTRGWVRLGHLTRGDLVCVLPAADIEPPARSSGDGPKKALFDDGSLQGLPFPPKNARLASKRLRKQGLLPLYSDDPRLATIARILGHLFSDGSFYLTTENRRSGTYRSYTFDLCVGTESDERELREDFAKLGRKLPKGFETLHEVNVDGRPYLTRTRHVKLRDAGLAALFGALGAPVGDKVKNGTWIPSWLAESSADIQREFLAAYFGGDGTVPRIVGRGVVSQSSVGFHRIKEEAESGARFANQLSAMFSNLGVLTDSVESNPGYERKDGHATLEFRIGFKMSEENILRLCHSIGVRYCSKKAMSTGMTGEYLRVKSRIRRENEEKAKRVREMRTEGVQIKQIGELLASPQTTVTRWIQGTAHQRLVKANQLPSFEEWSNVARTGLQEPLIWESVVSIEEEAIPDVRDLTVDSEDHSFFANGFLVHNCDDHFHVEYLKDMLKAEKVYGILSIDSNEAGIGILSGDRLDVEDLMTSGISGKTRKGGQSARRYERGREMELTYFFNRVSEHVTRIFITDHNVGGVIVGGPGPTKENFMKGGYLDYRLQKNIIEVIDTSYSGREGIREIAEKAADKLQDVRFIEERKLVQKFLGEVNRPNGLAVYGLPKIIDALNRSNMDMLLVSDDINITKIKMVCKNCQTVKEKIVENQKKMQTTQQMLSEPCLKCGATDYETDESDVVDMLEEKAIQIGAKVEMISSGSEEGAMLKSFGGAAGFLRYRT
jgi:peptide chain release factor subunit 1